MLTKSVIVAVGLLVMVNRSLSLVCYDCECNDRYDYECYYCGPSPTCSYGVYKDHCDCCNKCFKGPGESCGGDFGELGSCGDGLECNEIYNIHSPRLNDGICVEKGQIDECIDTWPSTECITMNVWEIYNNSYTEVPACSCEDVVREGLCTDYDYQNLWNVCKLSCDICEPTSTTRDTTMTTLEDISTTPHTTITTPEATSTTPNAMITTSGIVSPGLPRHLSSSEG